MHLRLYRREILPGVDNHGVRFVVANNIDMGAVIEILQHQRKELLDIARRSALNIADKIILSKAADIAQFERVDIDHPEKSGTTPRH